jgi:hypothetical protein
MGYDAAMHEDHTPESPSPRKLPWADLILFLLVFVAGTVTGTLYMQHWGGTAHFFQEEFGPALARACGHGYRDLDTHALPEVHAFLHPPMHVAGPPRPDDCACVNLGESPPLQEAGAIQRRHRYLMESVAWSWRILGIRWSSLALLHGLLYGGTMTAAYGLFRLVMGRPMALVCVFVLLLSPLHLHYLPRLRDYSKAPFILGALACAGYAVRRNRSTGALAGAAALAGVLTGVGIGFRIDVLMAVPASCAALILLAPGWSRAPLRRRALALLAFVLAFLATGGPILMHLGQGGNKAHPALLGFSDLYDQRLGVESASYDVFHRFLDTEVRLTLEAYAEECGNAGEEVLLSYETPEYEHIADAYYSEILWNFPADAALRGYVASFRVLDELHAPRSQTFPRGIENPPLAMLFTLRQWLGGWLTSYTRYVAALGLLLVALHNLRLAIALFLGLLYCCGYSSVQFATRNYFHLEFVPLFAAGGLIDYATRRVWRLWRMRAEWPAWRRCAWERPPLRLAAFLGVVVLLVFAPLGVLRQVQSAQLRDTWSRYTPDGPAAVPLSAERSYPPPGDGQQRFAVGPAHFNNAQAAPSRPYSVHACLAVFVAPGEQPVTVTVRYDASQGDFDLSWSREIPAATQGHVLVFPVFMMETAGETPAWSRYAGIETPADQRDRITGVRVVEPPGGLFITLLLPEDAEFLQGLPLYQRIVR